MVATRLLTSMTTPFQRTRSLVLTKGLLQDIIDPEKTPGVPADIRSCAKLLLEHYPTFSEIEAAHQALPDLYGPVPPFSRLSGSADVLGVVAAATELTPMPK